MNDGTGQRYIYAVCLYTLDSREQLKTPIKTVCGKTLLYTHVIHRHTTKSTFINTNIKNQDAVAATSFQ